MRPVRAAGFVLYRRENGRVRYLVLQNARHGDLGFPKGKAEPGERALETALRETAEETGIGSEALRVSPHFRREVAYDAGDRDKLVTYLLAETEVTKIERSAEHARAEWCELGAACDALRHENLRGVLLDAATHLRDPLLRRGLDPAGARALLEDRAEPDSLLLAHSAEVAAMARALAERLGEAVDAGFVEAAALLHDVGRTRTHGGRHALEGFRLLCEAGHRGHAPVCLTHYTKGRPIEEFDRDPGLAREMWAACDLDRFPLEERLVALADALAEGDRRVTLERRYEGLRQRYGPSRFLERSHGIGESIRKEFEDRTGCDVYALLGI